MVISRSTTISDVGKGASDISGPRARGPHSCSPFCVGARCSRSELADCRRSFLGTVNAFVRPVSPMAASSERLLTLRKYRRPWTSLSWLAISRACSRSCSSWERWRGSSLHGSCPVRDRRRSSEPYGPLQHRSRSGLALDEQGAPRPPEMVESRIRPPRIVVLDAPSGIGGPPPEGSRTRDVDERRRSDGAVSWATRPSDTGRTVLAAVSWDRQAVAVADGEGRAVGDPVALTHDGPRRDLSRRSQSVVSPQYRYDAARIRTTVVPLRSTP